MINYFTDIIHNMGYYFEKQAQSFCNNYWFSDFVVLLYENTKDPKEYYLVIPGWKKENYDRSGGGFQIC